MFTHDVHQCPQTVHVCVVCVDDVDVDDVVGTADVDGAVAADDNGCWLVDVHVDDDTSGGVVDGSVAEAVVVAAVDDHDDGVVGYDDDDNNVGTVVDVVDVADVADNVDVCSDDDTDDCVTVVADDVVCWCLMRSLLYCSVCNNNHDPQWCVVIEKHKIAASPTPTATTA